jgi:hypothetical protein
MRKLRSTVSRLGPRGGSLRLGLLIGLTLSAVATGAQAATIFSTGFEPPDFTTGPARGPTGMVRQWWNRRDWLGIRWRPGGRF